MVIVLVENLLQNEWQFQQVSKYLINISVLQKYKGILKFRNVESFILRILKHNRRYGGI